MTSRYTLTLRRRLPYEGRLMDDLAARAPGRRAQRLRSLLLLGLDRDPPLNAFPDNDPAHETTASSRITILIHGSDPDDAMLRAELARIGRLNRQEWLRDRLLAGLFGVHMSIDFMQGPAVQSPLPHLVTEADRSTRPTIMATAPVPKVWSNDAEQVPPGGTAVHVKAIPHDAKPADKAATLATAIEAGNKCDDGGPNVQNMLAGLFG